MNDPWENNNTQKESEQSQGYDSYYSRENAGQSMPEYYEYTQPSADPNEGKGIPEYSAGADPYHVPAEPSRKGFPPFSIPAIIILGTMLLIFIFTVLISTTKYNAIRGLAGSPSVGLRNYEMVMSSSSFEYGFGYTLGYNYLRLIICAALSAVFCSLYYAMKKPGTLLTFACLWLIPVSVPGTTMNLLFPRLSFENPFLAFLVSGGPQIIGIICFSGGLFAYLNLIRKGRTGGGPYYGFLISLLLLLLRSMSTGYFASFSRSRFLDDLIMQSGLMNFNISASSAMAVIKVLFQVFAGIVPMIVLCILARRKSTRGKATLSILWVFLASLTSVLLALIFSAFIPDLGDYLGRSFILTLFYVIAWGSLGGLICYSFVHLMRRLPSFLYGVVAVILSASMSCIMTQYLAFRAVGLINTAIPQMLLSAFDWRLMLVVPLLAFALRNHMENRPGSLVMALALLTGAVSWGEVALPVTYISSAQNAPVSWVVRQLSASTGGMSQNYQMTEGILMMIIPALLLGVGAALLMKRAFGLKTDFR